MFIKILTPNHNGKIELTARDLEALLTEAAEKAVREKCANCTRCYGISYLGSNSTNVPSNIGKSITYGTNTKSNIQVDCNNTDGATSLMNKITDMLGEQR